MKKELKNQISKHQKKMKEVFDKVKVVEEGKDFEELLELAYTYYKDAEYFRKKEKWVQSFEALIISWTYVDAGLRLEIFEVPDELKDYFTI